MELDGGAVGFGQTNRPLSTAISVAGLRRRARDDEPMLREPVSPFTTNDQGDITGIMENGHVKPFDPSSFGWLRRGGANDPGDERRPLDALRAVPGMKVCVNDFERRVPGPRTRTRAWGAWPEGAAPPAALMSKGGRENTDASGQPIGTLAYFDRLTEAVGQIARNLPKAPGRSPMVVYDFVNGQRIEVSYSSPTVKPGGAGTVYLLDDGAGIKIGWTSGDVAARVAGLQTGNSTVIVQVASILDAGVDVEAHLHTVLAAWHLNGEWFQRGHIVAAAAAKQSFNLWLRSVLPPGDWSIVVHPPYA